MDTSKVYLLLGANEGDCVGTFAKARQEISDAIGSITLASKIYSSPAWGFDSPQDFYNQVLCVETQRDPYAVLRQVQRIEQNLGRVRTPVAQSLSPWQKKEAAAYTSRTIDIDILFYDTAIIQSRNLYIPHPLMHERAFTMVPLAEICPELVHPVFNKTMEELCAGCQDAVQNVREVELTSESVYSFTRCFGHPMACARDISTEDSLERTLLKTGNSEFRFPSSLRFMAIEGNIGAGKTSLSRKIAQQFGARLVVEKFEDNVFLPKFYQNKERFAFPLELTFLAERYRQAKEDFVQDLFSPFIVSDFSIAKSLIFSQGNLQPDEYDLFARLFHIILGTVPKPDLYVYLHSDVDRLMSNIAKRGRSYEADMDPEYLRMLERGYFDYIRTLPREKTLVIDVTRLDFVHNQAHYDYVLSEIIGALHRG